MLLALQLLLSAALAAAPVPVQLPSSEAANGWPEILAATGLAIGVPMGQSVLVLDAGDGATWKVHVIDAKGKAQDLAVLIPTNPQERDDLAWYLAKLVGAEPPPLVPLTPAPVTPKPAPVAATPAPVATAPVATAPVATAPAQKPEPAPRPPKPEPAPRPPKPEPVVAAQPVAAPPTQTTSTTTHEPASSTSGFFARVAFDGDIRGRTAVSFTPEIAVGGRFGPVRAGAWADIRTMSDLTDAKAGRGFRATEFGATAWVIGGPVGGGLLGGVSLRDYRSDGTTVESLTVPVVGAEALGHIKLVSHLALEPLLRFQYDLRTVQLQVNRGETVTLPAWELRLGVGLSWN